MLDELELMRSKLEMDALKLKEISEIEQEALDAEIREIKKHL